MMLTACVGSVYMQPPGILKVPSGKLVTAVMFKNLHAKSNKKIINSVTLCISRAESNWPYVKRASKLGPCSLGPMTLMKCCSTGTHVFSSFGTGTQ